MNYKKIKEEMDQALLADGFNDAIMGYTRKEEEGPLVAMYNIEKMINILIARDGMTEEEAYEYFYFNIEGAYMGEKTPVYMHVEDTEIIIPTELDASVQIA